VVGKAILREDSPCSVASVAPSHKGGKEKERGRNSRRVWVRGGGGRNSPRKIQKKRKKKVAYSSSNCETEKRGRDLLSYRWAAEKRIKKRGKAEVKFSSKIAGTVEILSQDRDGGGGEKDLSYYTNLV